MCPEEEPEEGAWAGCWNGLAGPDLGPLGRAWACWAGQVPVVLSRLWTEAPGGPPGCLWAVLWSVDVEASPVAVLGAGWVSAQGDVFQGLGKDADSPLVQVHVVVQVLQPEGGVVCQVHVG